MNNEQGWCISAIDNALRVADKVRDEFARVLDLVSTLTQCCASKDTCGAVALSNIDRSLRTVVQYVHAMANRPPTVVPTATKALGLDAWLALRQRGTDNLNGRGAQVNASMPSENETQHVGGFRGPTHALTRGMSGMANPLGRAAAVAGARSPVVDISGAVAAGTDVAAIRPLAWLREFNLPAFDPNTLLSSKNIQRRQSKVLLHSAAERKHHLMFARRKPSDPAILAFVQKFIDMGWTPVQASGIVANIFRESEGGDPHWPGDSGKAYGLGQWHPNRQAFFKEQFGHDIRTSTSDEQLQFYNWELFHKERRAWKKLKQTTVDRDAGSVVSKYYERPKDQKGEMALRGELAHQIHQAYKHSQEMRHKSSVDTAMDGGSARMAGENNNLADVLASAIQKIPIHVTVSAPPGTRVEVSKANKPSLPTRVNYSMPLGGML